ITYSLTRFAIYETVRDMMGNTGKGPMPFYQKVLLGTYKHAVDGLYRVFREGKRRGQNQVFILYQLKPFTLLQGLVPAGIRLIPHTVLTFVFLEQLKKYFGIRIIS
ncbi:hypothetical protein GOODEAATRI_029419, partial [Goodea atripinnis]